MRLSEHLRLLELSSELASTDSNSQDQQEVVNRLHHELLERESYWEEVQEQVDHLQVQYQGLMDEHLSLKQSFTAQAKQHQLVTTFQATQLQALQVENETLRTEQETLLFELNQASIQWSEKCTALGFDLALIKRYHEKAREEVDSIEAERAELDTLNQSLEGQLDDAKVIRLTCTTVLDTRIHQLNQQSYSFNST